MVQPIKVGKQPWEEEEPKKPWELSYEELQEYLAGGQSIPYLGTLELEDVDTGEPVKGFVVPDGTVMVGMEPYGHYDVETNIFTPKPFQPQPLAQGLFTTEPIWGEIELGTTEVGKPILGTVLQDNTVWHETQQIGTFEPETSMFTPTTPPEVEEYTAYVQSGANPLIRMPVTLKPDSTVWLGKYQLGTYDSEAGIYTTMAGEVQTLHAQPTGPAEFIEMVGAPYQFGAEMLAAGATAPFRPEAVRPAASLEEAFFGGAILEPYKEWEEPTFFKVGEYEVKPTKGIAEIIATVLLFPGGGGGATVKASQFWTKVLKINAKRLAGKTLKPAEHRILGRAIDIEAAWSRQITEQSTKRLLGQMPTVEEIIAANYRPTFARTLATKMRIDKIPGVRGTAPATFTGFPGESAIVTNTRRGAYAWGQMMEMAESGASTAVDAHLRSLGRVFTVNRATGLVSNVKPKIAGASLNIHSIATYPDRYILTAVQRTKIDVAHRMMDESLSMFKKLGGNVRELTFEDGGLYFPRFFRDIGEYRKVSTAIKKRIGAKQTWQKQRWYEDIEDGIAAGKPYLYDFDEAVETLLHSRYKAIADLQVANYLKLPKFKGLLPRERIAQHINEEARKTAYDYAGARHFQKVLNRAIRGEALPEVTIQAQIRRFPNLGAELRTALGNKPALRTLLKRVKVLTEQLREPYWKARAIRVRAMERARMPIVGREGTINQAVLQGRIYPIEVSEAANQIFASELESNRILNAINWAINAPARMGNTAIDTGFGVIQGQLMLFNRPDLWGRAMTRGIGSFGVPQLRANLIKRELETVTEMWRHGAAAFGRSEFTQAGRRGGLLAKIPVVGRIFTRAGGMFETFLDTSRIILYKAKKLQFMARYGRPLTDAELTDLVKVIDHTVGVSSMRALGVSGIRQSVEQLALYAPRFFRAFVSMLIDCFQGGIRGTVAREVMAKWLIGMPIFMSALAMALGQKERITPTKENPLPIMFDPRTGQFMAVEIAGIHMGWGGPYIALFRLFASMARAAQDDPKAFISIDPHENPILRYGYGRASPVAGATIDIATGRNFLGERLDTPQKYLFEVIDKTFPFWAAGAITDVPESGWPKGVAEWWGLRAWMVQYWEEARRMAENLIPQIPAEMVMPEQQNKITQGQPLTYDDLNNEQRAWLLEQYDDYREMQERAWEQRVEQYGTDYVVAEQKARDMLDAAYAYDLYNISTNTIIGAATLENYMEQSEYLRRIRFGQFQMAEAIKQFIEPEEVAAYEKWRAENQKPEDKAYEDYMQLRANVPKPSGVPDWDKWELQLDNFLKKQTPEVRAYIQRRLDDWISSLPENAQTIERMLFALEDNIDPYYDIRGAAMVTNLATGKPMALSESERRIRFREEHPDIDASLVILRGLKPRTEVAAVLAAYLLELYGVPQTALGEPSLTKEQIQRRDELTARAGFEWPGPGPQTGTIKKKWDELTSAEKKRLRAMHPEEVFEAEGWFDWYPDGITILNTTVTWLEAELAKLGISLPTK